MNSNIFKWVVYRILDGQEEAVGCLRYAEDAAILVSALGYGAEVRSRGYTLWVEGVDGHAYDSYDAAAELMHQRLDGVTGPVTVDISDAIAEIRDNIAKRGAK